MAGSGSFNYAYGRPPGVTPGANESGMQPALNTGIGFGAVQDSEPTLAIPNLGIGFDTVPDGADFYADAENIVYQPVPSDAWYRLATASPGVTLRFPFGESTRLNVWLKDAKNAAGQIVGVNQVRLLVTTGDGNVTALGYGGPTQAQFDRPAVGSLLTIVCQANLQSSGGEVEIEVSVVA